MDRIESGLEVQEPEKHCLDLLEQPQAAEDPAEQKRLTAELARCAFGEP